MKNLLKKIYDKFYEKFYEKIYKKIASISETRSQHLTFGCYLVDLLIPFLSHKEHKEHKEIKSARDHKVDPPDRCQVGKAPSHTRSNAGLLTPH